MKKLVIQDHTTMSVGEDRDLQVVNVFVLGEEAGADGRIAR